MNSQTALVSYEPAADLESHAHAVTPLPDAARLRRRLPDILDALSDLFESVGLPAWDKEGAPKQGALCGIEEVGDTRYLYLKRADRDRLEMAKGPLAAILEIFTQKPARGNVVWNGPRKGYRLSFAIGPALPALA